MNLAAPQPPSTQPQSQAPVFMPAEVAILDRGPPRPGISQGSKKFFGHRPTPIDEDNIAEIASLAESELLKVRLIF